MTGRTSFAYVTPLVVCAQRRRIAGFTLFEFAVVAAIFGILVTVLLNRMTYYQMAAEEANTRTMVASLRGALALKVGSLRAKNRTADIAELYGQNPMLWLEREPFNYSGEYYSANASEAPPGSWYFNRDRKCIVYVSREKKSLQSLVPNRISFKVESLRLPTHTAKPTEASDSSIDAVLNQVDG